MVQSLFLDLVSTFPNTVRKRNDRGKSYEIMFK